MYFPERKELLDQIANYLLVNSCNFDNLGLFQGKMGIALFFAHYSRYTQKVLYNDFAMEIITNIYQDIHSSYPIGFANGFSGIGWGIEYLVQNKFVEGDTQEILEDIDARIIEIDPLRIRDISFKKGLYGISYYIACHVKSLKYNESIIDSDYLHNISAVFEKNMHIILHDDMSQVCDQVLSFLKPDTYSIDNQKKLSILDLLIANTEITKEINWSQMPLGIENGMAGLGLKLMMP